MSILHSKIYQQFHFQSYDTYFEQLNYRQQYYLLSHLNNKCPDLAPTKNTHQKQSQALKWNQSLNMKIKTFDKTCVKRNKASFDK